MLMVITSLDERAANSRKPTVGSCGLPRKGPPISNRAISENLTSLETKDAPLPERLALWLVGSLAERNCSGCVADGSRVRPCEWRHIQRTPHKSRLVRS